ncbi:hypothetical protein RIF29_20101 [Crotalaria pallida]|uniref:Uncharacterized protein n=1 Tax=Crotalaria pallida TaxID=3830 RepID=A0AAN9I616_CROPI
MNEKPIPKPGPSSDLSIGWKGMVKPTRPSNHLLAGCLAYEYLTEGTLMGQPWPMERKRKRAKRGKKEKERYAEVVRHHR